MNHKIISSTILGLGTLMMAVCMAAMPEDPNWMQIFRTVQSIEIPAIPPALKDSIPAEDVILRMKLTSTGEVETIERVSGSLQFAELAMGAAKKWKFGPGPLASKVPQHVEVSFRFKVQKDHCSISSEEDAFIVTVPLERPDPRVLIAAGSTLGSMAAERAQPPFPPHADRMSGRIIVVVETDQTGKVLSATPSAGPPAYQAAAKEAALKWRFREIQVNGVKVHLFGNLVFNWNVIRGM